MSDTADFFRARLDEMVDIKHPLVVLSKRLPWGAIEQALAPHFARKARPGLKIATQDLLGEHQVEFGAGISPAGRPRLGIRLMASLQYLKNAFNLSDEELVLRWSENVVWQYFSGMTYYEPRLPCDPTQIGRFRRALGEEGLEQLLKATIETAVEIKAIKPAELERVIADTTVQEKAMAHPVDSRLLEIARHKVVSAAKRCDISLKQTFAAEGKTLRRKAGGYAHAKQFKRLKKAVKRQRTILGVVMREVQRKLGAMKSSETTSAEATTAVRTAATSAATTPAATPTTAGLNGLATLLERAERIRTQKRADKNKLYALHAPEVECIGKGKARKPYEFGVKVSLVVTHLRGLMVGARSFTGNPYDGHTLAAQLEQTRNLMQDVGRTPKQVIVDLGYRGVDADNPGVQIIHRGKYKSLTSLQRKWLKRRQAIEPLIGHTKADHGMQRCWLQGALGDALHALSCAAGYNIRWLLRAIAGKTAKDAKAFLMALFGMAVRGKLAADRAFQALAGAAGLLNDARGCWISLGSARLTPLGLRRLA
jgi:transposase, IS5 family